MDLKQIIEEIEKLPEAKKVELYSYVNTKVRKKAYLLALLNDIKGSGKGIWNLDAQEYVNRLRSDDRI
jgi:hypothetical protein